MHTTRRRTLRAAPALGALGLAQSLGLEAARAQAADDYRALVIVFLGGGNDGINTLVPTSDAGYGAYNRVRPPGSDLNIPRASLLPVTLPGTSERYGLHPSLAPLQQLFNDQKVAVIANAGTLVQPTTKQDIVNGAPVPISLLSHPDQINQWHTCVYRDVGREGWAGRITNVLDPLNAASGIPVGITTNPLNPAILANSGTQPLALPVSGEFKMFVMEGDYESARAVRDVALQHAWRTDERHVLMRAHNEVMRAALTLSRKVNPVLTNTGTGMQRFFPSPGNWWNSFQSQFLVFARLMEARQSLGVKRQVFYAEVGGYDTHGDQLNIHRSLLSELGIALRGLYDATDALGLRERVTTLVITEFGRTFVPAAGRGTDHGWGNQQFVIGGAVRGGVYGTMPVLEPGGPDDFTREGRWIPKQSLEQVGATAARWMGLTEAQLDTAFPNLGRFGSRNLGFMG